MENLIGRRFGKLTVIDKTDNYIPPSQKYQLSQWKCICDCGKETIVIGSNLKRGNTTSCGCEAIKTRSLNGKKTHPKLWEYCMKPIENGGLGMKKVMNFIDVPVE